MGLFGISDQHKYKHKNYIFITHGGRISSLFPNPISCRSSEDVTANLGAHVTSVTIVANNENTTVSIAPSIPLAQALISVLEEMEESFQLVTKATVTPLSSTEFEISVSGYYDSEDRVICGGLCVGGAVALFSYSLNSGWWGY